MKNPPEQGVEAVDPVVEGELVGGHAVKVHVLPHHREGGLLQVGYH